jgi:toxin ParE1/3/4
VKVEWSPLADEQVDDAVAYISGDTPTAALQWLERLLDRAMSLATFPDSGRVVPELGRQDIREIIVSPYRVMYRRKDDLWKSRPSGTRRGSSTRRTSRRRGCYPATVPECFAT